jgi:hypothetical protein
MRLDTADDPGAALLDDSMLSQDSPGQLGAFFRVADPAVRPVLLFSADIMEQRRQFQDLKVGPFLPADTETWDRSILYNIPAAPDKPLYLPQKK